MDSSEFDALEQHIQHLVRQFSADSILLKVRAAVDDSETPGTVAHGHFKDLPYGLPPFVSATICDFVMCYGSPSGEAASWPEFRDIALACHDYALEDPISHDEAVNEAFRKAPLTPFMSRVLAKQWEYHTNPYGWMARCKLLWQEAMRHAIDAGDSSFDFHQKFELLFGVSLDDYLTVAIHAQDFARQHKRGFTRQVFNNRRAEGYGIPNDAVVKAVLAKFSADSNAYQGEFEQWTPNDRRFRMYTPSPLLTYPLLRPWTGSERKNRTAADRLVAPIWWLVMRRISDTIYYALRDVDQWRNDFLKFFGSVFSAYVGRILEAGFGSGRTWNIDEVVHDTPLAKKKHPDWVVLDGEVLVLVECKASIFPSMTLFRSSPRRYKKVVAQKIGKAITQLSRFRKEIENEDPSLPEELHAVDKVVGIVITYERFPLVNSPLGRQFVRDVIKSEESFEEDIEWAALSLDELEFLDPYFGQQNSLSSLTDSDARFQDHLTELGEAYSGTDTESLLRSTAQEVLTEYLKFPEGAESDGAGPQLSPDLQSPTQLSRCPLCLTPFRTSDDETKEHIIPRALWNKSYELHFTCGDCNHFMAHSFENAFTCSKFTKSVQETFCPPPEDTAGHRRTLHTLSGDELHLYVNGDSFELRMPPQVKETTNEVAIELLDVDGDTHRVPLTIPFDLPSQIAASNHYDDKTTQRAQQKLQRYIEKLWRDVSGNERFARYLDKHGIELDTNQVPEVPVSTNNVAEIPFEEMGVPDLVDELPFEEALRFFGKIALLHTCRQLGPEALNNPVSADLRTYLLEGKVAPEIVDWNEHVEEQLGQWIRSPVINGKSTTLWAETPEQIKEAIDKQDPPLPVDLRDALNWASDRRINRRKQVRRYFILPPQVGIDSLLRSLRSELAYHSLEFVGLRDLVDESLSVNPTGCRIKLFGGLFDVIVQVSKEPLSFGPEHSVRIDFDERVPLPD